MEHTVTVDQGQKGQLELGLPKELFIVKTSAPVYDGAEAGEKKPPLYRVDSDGAAVDADN